MFVLAYMGENEGFHWYLDRAFSSTATAQPCRIATTKLLHRLCGVRVPRCVRERLMPDSIRIELHKVGKGRQFALAEVKIHDSIDDPQSLSRFTVSI